MMQRKRGNQSQKQVWIGVLVLMVLAVCSAVTSCKKKEAHEEAAPVVRPVKLIELSEGDVALVRSFPGRVRASQAVTLSFEVAGRLVELPISRGQQVKKGELLAKLDQRDFKNTRAKQKAKLENARANLDRAQRLLASGSISQQEYDNRKTLFDTAEAEFKIADKALEDTEIKAPFEGLVADKFVDRFQFVQAKQAILSLQDVSHIEITVDVPEDMIAWARHKEYVKSLKASFEAIPGKLFDVEVKEFRAQANKQTQTFAVTVTMPAPKNFNILAGMTATIMAETALQEKEKNAPLAIPESAVSADADGKPYVWVVDTKSMTAKKRYIKPGRLTGDKMTVWDGLKPGETIIGAGVNAVRENMKVRAMEGRTGGRR